MAFYKILCTTQIKECKTKRERENYSELILLALKSFSCLKNGRLRENLIFYVLEHRKQAIGTLTAAFYRRICNPLSVQEQ